MQAMFVTQDRHINVNLATPSERSFSDVARLGRNVLRQVNGELRLNSVETLPV